MRGEPTETQTDTISGIGLRIDLYQGRDAAIVTIDQEALLGAGPADVFRVWAHLARWTERFLAANPTWSINGRKLETEPESE